MTTPEVRPGLTHERVGVFADAIFAIAITLLALELPRPEGEDRMRLPAFLGEHVSSFVAFGIAFGMLWVAWRAHHRLFDQVARLSQAVITLHLPLLFLVACLPYVTSLFGDVNRLPDEAAGGGRATAIALFAGTEALLMLCQGTMIGLVLRQGLYREGSDLSRLRTEGRVDWGIGAFWALTAVAAAWMADVVPLLWMATPVVAYGVARVSRLRNRRLAAQAG
ncbi:TMEM175 family protein [Microbispora sp. NPDC049125]|uniref:TMEM175 family protein n=1 Tax=Microbispora sp. NPDC049125 TaxID=3154929 RepID=UPI003467242C